MLLVVDIGNTNTCIGLYEGQTLVKDFRMESAKGRTRDEYHVLIYNLLHISGLDHAQLSGSIIASVVPALTDPIAEAIHRTFGSQPLIVGAGIKTSMPILCDQPKEVGADRIVNAVAAFEKHKQALIVVDFGTATNFDCVSAKGEYLGGVICPGIQIGADALFSRAAKLSRIQIAKPPRVIGKNTTHAVQSGLVFGSVAMVDGLLARIQEDMGTVCKVIATGGFAPMVAEESELIEEMDPHLTLEGLRILFERNL